MAPNADRRTQNSRGKKNAKEFFIGASKSKVKVPRNVPTIDNGYHLCKFMLRMTGARDCETLVFFALQPDDLDACGNQLLGALTVNEVVWLCGTDKAAFDSCGYESFTAGRQAR